MQSGKEVKLPSLGLDDKAVLKSEKRARVRFLVASARRSVDEEKPLATATQHSCNETNGNTENNETRRVGAPAVNMTRVVPSNFTRDQNPDFERQAREDIRQKNEQLHTLVTEQDDLKNEVAVAQYAIMELKARLAEANYTLGSAKHHEDSLRLEVGKLKREREKLQKRCENAAWERVQRLRAKDEKIKNVQADTHRTLKLHDEVVKRNQDLKEKLEKREKIVWGLKTKVHMMTNWSVR